ncbi:MAG: DUF4124 domain-containing protein [Oleiphilaceae bacterium]|nr:DUF4124 domain-containing protein [Oleiphilaceae bacterium]
MRAVSLLSLTAVCLAMSLSALTASATPVYKHVDEQGNVSFSDSPQSGQSEKIEVRPSQGISLPKPQQRPSESRQSRSGNGSNAAASGYESIRITQPEDDSAFWRTSGEVAIQVSSEPALRQGHSYQLEMDGEMVKQQSGATFNLENVDRGTHEVRVHILDREGNIVESSEPSRFTVHRHSILNNPQ